MPCHQQLYREAHWKGTGVSSQHYRTQGQGANMEAGVPRAGLWEDHSSLNTLTEAPRNPESEKQLCLTWIPSLNNL